MQDLFLSLDWGTSNFRLRLVQTGDASVLAEVTAKTGIAERYKQWQAANLPGTQQLSFYQSYITTQINQLQQKTNTTLREIPVVVSGMASSSIGMLELPYKELPLQTDGTNLHVHVVEQTAAFKHPMLLISGAKTGDDVLRGEETLLIGCVVKPTKNECVFLFPGTHSKHITVQSGSAQRFKTYMTGEWFELLSTKSILSNSVAQSLLNQSTGAMKAFEKGMLEGASSTLLNSAFHVRTAQLFQKHTATENYHYLSGLLIGTELKDLVLHPPAALCLVCGKNLEPQYQHGLTILGLHQHLQLHDADEALIKGQLKILEQQRRNGLKLH